jgi:hypothetical protein
MKLIMQEYLSYSVAVTRWLSAAAMAVIFLSSVEPGRGAVLLFDSFGLGTTLTPRLDSGGAPVTVGLGTDLSGVRAEIPLRGHESQWGYS